MARKPNTDLHSARAQPHHLAALDAIRAALKPKGTRPPPGELGVLFETGAVLGDDIARFYEALDALDSLFTREMTGISRRAFGAIVAAELASEEQCETAAVVERIRDRLTAQPIVPWSVSCVVRGARLPSRLPEELFPFRLGPFLLWEAPTHLAVVDAVPQNHRSWAQQYVIEGGLPMVLATLEGINAREHLFVEEQAGVAFDQFDNVLQYALRWHDLAHDIGVMRYGAPQRIDYVVSSSTAAGSGGSFRGATEIVILDPETFAHEEDGTARVWEILRSTSRSDMEKRILRAVEWVGRSRRDEDPSKALVQIVFALEALIQGDGHKLVNPSITYSIAETCAFVLGDDEASRFELERTVRSIYAARSAVAHGNADRASLDVKFDALKLVSDLIARLLTHEDFRNLTSAKDLGEWVRKRKYR